LKGFKANSINSTCLHNTTVTQHFSWQTAVLVLLYIFVKYRTFTKDDHNL